ncbi:MAG: VCBS repeat-containing protein [Verrucomicrobiales bacterium]|nr:VCBS repeat-containing protein [Verrucomicrobiales bacterium]
MVSSWMACVRVRITPRVGWLFAHLALAWLLAGCGKAGAPAGDDFQKLSSQGRGLYESGEAAKAVEAFRKAADLMPTHPDARQNLAIALLRANDPASAAVQANELIRMNQNLGAAHFLLGAALLRQGKAEAALTELQVSKDIDRTVNATSYLLGRAHFELGHFEDAANLFDEVLQFETNHPSAYYNLSQSLTRLGKSDEAAKALESHRALLAQRGGASVDPSAVEAGDHTKIRVPFKLDPPETKGLPVAFVDGTSSSLGTDAGRFSGPIGVLDIGSNGSSDLFVRDGEAQFRLLLNSGGRFQPAPNAAAVTPGAHYTRVLVGDLNRDRYEDLVVLGDRGLHAFRLATNGVMNDSTAFSNLRNQPAEDGLMADLDFTGNLDLVLLTPTNRAVKVLRNLGNMYFTNGTASSGFPVDGSGWSRLTTDDWNGDELNDFILATGPTATPRLLLKQRGGPLTNTPSPQEWPAGAVMAVGDFNNDLRQDVAIAGDTQLTIVLNGFPKTTALSLGGLALRDLNTLDYDNDGWLDLVGTTATGLKLWRNTGDGSFQETTAGTGLESLPKGKIDALALTDIDNDGDTDFVVSMEGQGLKVFRNDGGNANRQLKLRLLGTRSNGSGLGLRIELTSGNWRALRTVQHLPVEIGVGKRDKIDALNVRWFDTMSTDIDTPVQQGQQVALVELVRPTGSCPYLYRWDGERFTFVTDLLGGAPVGLPAAEGFYIEADPDELAWIGDQDVFRPRNGYYAVQVTEELREVLYLDEAKLVVVDHPPDVEVHPTDKLMPGRPFPPTDLVALRHRIPLRRATDFAGTDVTTALERVDQVMVSPRQLRPPQQRGHAEPHGVELDFGTLDTTRPLALALTGWLRFGGGMANIAASRDPDLPFPFPRLEAQTPDGWKPVDLTVGAPCGKTKTIIVDLAGKLPTGTTRLRLSTSFEIHWDRIALFERVDPAAAGVTVARLAPDRTDLHWRGYAEFKDLPWTQPLTPDYDRVRAWPDWRITPTGWCTRYGAVDELIAARDGGLALLNGGDELTLEFGADRLPPAVKGARRSFFLFTVGWDKDADFHVVLGDRVEPLPWEGMNDQQYGKEPRPEHPGDVLNRRYNTRWVGSMAQVRRPQPSSTP